MAEYSLSPGRCVTLARGVRRVVAGNAGMMTGPGTNTYLLGEREITVLDPGPDDGDHMRAILDAAGEIRFIAVTHTHRDHSPLALPLARRTGAQVIGLPAPRDGHQDERFVAGREPGDGERLVLGDCTLTAIHTPGHASNCVCYLLENQRLLFTGDHVLQGVTPVILPPDGDMAAYMHSVAKLLPYDFDRIAPGHGGVMDDGKQVLEALRRHRLAREDKVLRCLAAQGVATLASLTTLVYDDVPPDRHPWARRSLEAHLIKLVREGRVMEQNGSWRCAPA